MSGDDGDRDARGRPSWGRRLALAGLLAGCTEGAVLLYEELRIDPERRFNLADGLLAFMRLPVDLLMSDTAAWRLSSASYVALQIAFDVVALLLLWLAALWAATRLLRVRRRRAERMRAERSDCDRSAVPPGKGRWRRRIVFGAGAAVLLYFALVGFAGGLVGWICLESATSARAALGIPCRATTAVNVEDEVRNPQDGAEKRPVLLIVPGSSRQALRGAERAWSWSCLLDEASRMSEAATGRQRSRAEIMEMNLAGVVKLSRGWLRSEGEGYVLCLDSSVPPTASFSGADARFPAGTEVLSDDLGRTCKLIQALTGVKIEVDAGRLPPKMLVPDDCSWPHEVNEMDLIAGVTASAGTAGSEVCLKQRFFAAAENTDIAGFLSGLADFHNGIAEIGAAEARLKGLTDQEMEKRVASMFETWRMDRGESDPDSRYYRLPGGSAKFVVRYLDGSDTDALHRAVDALRILDEPEAIPALRALLATGQTKGGMRLTRSTLGTVAGALMDMHDEAGLIYAVESGEYRDRYSDKQWLMKVGSVHTRMAADLQAAILGRHRLRKPVVVPGRMRIEGVPPGVTEQEARQVESLALDCLNAFFPLRHDAQADATITFSKDGTSAGCSLQIWHLWAPLAGAGTSFYVEMEKHGALWFIVGCSGGEGQWWS